MEAQDFNVFVAAETGLFKGNIEYYAFVCASFNAY
jgi:hypothetical protein